MNNYNYNIGFTLDINIIQMSRISMNIYIVNLNYMNLS